MQVKKTFGINPQASLMYPCSEEVGQVLTVAHGAAAIVFGVKFNQSEKSKKPWSKDIAQCLSASCHDASVVMIRAKEKKHK